MFKELEEIDVSAIDELAAIKEEQEVLEERLKKLEDERENVSSAVFERVENDYLERREALEEKARPLKETARGEYTKLRRLSERMAGVVEKARLDQEEVELRHKLGELDEEAYQERLAGCRKEVEDRQAELGEVEAVMQRFAGAFRSEDELLGQSTPSDVLDAETLEIPAPPTDAAVETEARTMVLPRKSSQPEPQEPPDPPGATVVMQMPRLVAHHEEGATDYRLGTAPLVIGRAEDADVRFPIPSVSRHHAQVDPGPDGFVVTDLGSGNGTRINGELLAGNHVLRDGDTIQVGTELVTFHAG
jgi:hypothetical protein